MYMVSQNHNGKPQCLLEYKGANVSIRKAFIVLNEKKGKKGKAIMPCSLKYIKQALGQKYPFLVVWDLFLG